MRRFTYPMLDMEQRVLDGDALFTSPGGEKNYR